MNLTAVSAMLCIFSEGKYTLHFCLRKLFFIKNIILSELLFFNKICNEYARKTGVDVGFHILYSVLTTLEF